MNPSKVKRSNTKRLTDLPNIGPAMAGHLESIGIKTLKDLEGRDPWELYDALWECTKARPDPCVLDTFMSLVDYLSGGAPRPWWAYTEERKKRYGRMLDDSRDNSVFGHY